MVRIVSLSVLLTLIVVLGLTFFKVLAPFLLPLFLAAVFAILCQPAYIHFLDRTKGRIRLAAGLTTAAVVAVILIPLVVGTVLASLQLFVLATTYSDRNIGRVVRETTDPVFQFAADFLNARTLPRPESANGSDADGDEETERGTEPAADALPEDASAAAADVTDNANPALDSEETSSARSASPDGQAAEASSNDDEPAEGPASSDAPADPGANAEDALDWLPVSPRGPPQKFTADGLRTQFQTWVRNSLSEVGRKSLGVGTLDVLSGSVVAVGSALLGFVIFAVALYYFLADGTHLIRATERLIPVHVDYQRQMLNQFAKVVRAVVLATFFAALAQSMATVAALWLLGFDHLLVLLLVALLVSMIPMMGTWLVWLPCAAYLLYSGHWFQALLLTVYGAAFIGMLDNVVRTYILNTDVKLHPLLALISVLGGLQVMGLWGMFVGPIVASCLHALVKIFNHELAALSKEKFAGLEGLDETRETDESPPPVIPTPPLPSVAKDEPPVQSEPSEEDDPDASTAES